MNRENRIEWVDEWKGMLILLVVLGHIAGGMCHYASGDANAIMRYVYRFIYLFHMPAFFMVAGYLWRSRADVPMAKVAKRRMDRLVIPYFAWGMFSAAILVGTESVARMLADGPSWYYGERMFGFQWWRPFVSILHAGDWPNGEGFRCNSVLWFLPCMFVVLMFYDVLERVGRKRQSQISGLWFDGGLVVMFFVLGAVMRFYAPKYLPWEISRAPYMIIFFLIGRLLNMAKVVEKLKLPASVVVVGWIAYGYSTWCYPDLAVGYGSWKWYAYAVALAVAGCVLSLCTALAWRSGMFVRLGVASMGIMLVHKFFVLPIQLCYGRLANCGTVAAVLTVIVSLAIVTAVAYVAAIVIRRFIPAIIGE